jgi:2-keto-4-pentenoate hydratase
VQLTNNQGQLLASGKGSDILGQPLNAVVWIAQALQKDGITLQPGDLISLGSFSPLLPPRPGLSVTASYVGLPGAQPVQVHFKQ